MTSKRTVERARALIGTRFRPQGRDPRSGLDCIGLVICACRLNPSGIADDYRLSSPARSGELLAGIERRFRRVTRLEPGRLVLFAFGKRQLHLAIATRTGIVHADARRGMVVETPWPNGATVMGIYRKRRRALDKE